MNFRVKLVCRLKIALLGDEIRGGVGVYRSTRPRQELEDAVWGDRAVVMCRDRPTSLVRRSVIGGVLE